MQRDAPRRGARVASSGLREAGAEEFWHPSRVRFLFDGVPGVSLALAGAQPPAKVWQPSGLAWSAPKQLGRHTLLSSCTQFARYRGQVILTMCRSLIFFGTTAPAQVQRIRPRAFSNVPMQRAFCSGVPTVTRIHSGN